MLQFITHYNERYDYLSGAEQALKGGCKWVQLRVKDQSDDQIEDLALAIQSLCREFDAVFIIDDRVELVKKIGADGVHLGKGDMSPKDARAILGSEAIIGGTANTFEDIKELKKQGVNYIGLGPFRFTTTKQNLSQILGLEGYSQIISACQNEGINLPIVAIGGITIEDIPAIIGCDVSGIALSGTILSAESPSLTTSQVMEELRKCKK